MARRRLDAITPPPVSEAPGRMVDAPKPRVPFVSLVEGGKVAVGATLRLQGTDIRAVVHDNGTITANGKRGSIHKIGAICLDLPACNGWTHWLYADAETGQEHLLDHLRPHE